MSAKRFLFVPRAVLLKTSSLRGCRGMVVVAAESKPLPVQPRKTSFWETVQAEAEKLGHICEDHDMNSDGDSPLEWCPACRYLANARSHDAWGKALLAGISPNPLERTRVLEGGDDFQTREERRWRTWVSTLKPLDRFTLRVGGVEAKLLVKTGFHGVQMSWADKMIACDPEYLTRKMPVVVRPVIVALPQQREVPVRVYRTPSATAASVQEFATSSDAANKRCSSELREFISMDQRPSAEKDAEYADWITNSKRSLWTSQGAEPYRAISESNRSSLLVTGFGPEVSLAEIREIAAGFAPVRDVFRPARAQHMVFVGYVGASAASAAKSHFRANPISLGGRPLVFDVSVKK